MSHLLTTLRQSRNDVAAPASTSTHQPLSKSEQDIEELATILMRRYEVDDLRRFVATTDSADNTELDIAAGKIHEKLHSIESESGMYKHEEAVRLLRGFSALTAEAPSRRIVELSAIRDAIRAVKKRL